MYKEDTKYRLHTDCHRKGNSWADQDTSKYKQYVNTAVEYVKLLTTATATFF